MNPNIDSVDQRYIADFNKDDLLSKVMYKLSSMSPEERAAVLAKRGITEEDFLANFIEQAKKIEGEGGGESGSPEKGVVSEISKAIELGLPFGLAKIFGYLPTFSSMVFGAGAKGAGAALGASELTQGVLEFLGNLVSIGKGGVSAVKTEADIIKKYGPEIGQKMIDEIKGLAAKTTEESIGFLKQIQQAVAEGKLEPSQLPIKFAKKLANIIKEPNDEDLRLLKGGKFISQAASEEITKAQGKRLNRLHRMLEVFKDASVEEQEILKSKIADEFVKYQQLQTVAVEDIGKEGKSILRTIKHEWTDADYEDFKKYGENNYFPSMLYRIMGGETSPYNPLKNERGSTDIHNGLFNAAKQLIGGFSWDKMYKAEVTAQLSDPSMALRNQATDVINIPFQRAAQAAAIGWKSGNLSEGVKQFISAMHTFKESIPDAIAVLKSVSKSGIPEFENLLKVDHPQVFMEAEWKRAEPGIIGRWLASRYANGLNNILAADQATKLLAWRSNTRMVAMWHALEQTADFHGAERIAQAEKLVEQWLHGGQINLLTGKNEIPEWLLEASKKEMYKATFTNKNTIANMMNIAFKTPAIGGFLRTLFPYVRTPVNLVVSGMEMTPVLGHAMSFMSPSGSLERSATFAKATIGTVFATFIWDQVMKGNITGSGPVNRSQYSMNIPEPYSAFGISYKRMGPFATYIALIADAAEAYANAKPEDQNAIIQATSTALGKAAVNAPVLEEMLRWSEGIKNASRGNNDYLTSMATNYATGYIPAPLRMLSQSIDPEYKNARTTVDRVRKYIPGLSSEVPPYRKYNGSVQYLPPGVSADGTPPSTLSVLFNMMNPTPYYNEKIFQPFDKEIDRLGIVFSRIPNHRQVLGELVNITPQEQDKWNERIGTVKIGDMGLMDSGNELVNQDSYKSLSKEDQITLIKRHYYMYKNAAEYSVFGDSVEQPEPQPYKSVAERKAAIKIGE